MARLRPKNEIVLNGPSNFIDSKAGYGGKLPKGSMGPLGPQGPSPYIMDNPQYAAGRAAELARKKAGLADAWAAFHPQGGGAPQPQGASPMESAAQRAEESRAAYDRQFRAAMDAQRANIDVQLRQAMTDIGNRRAQAQQIVGMMPGEVNAIYDQANPAIDKQNAAAKSDLTAAGASAPTASQNAGVDAIKANIEASRAGALADQPYLNIGATDLFNRQAGAANQIAQDQRGMLGQVEMDHLSGMAQSAGSAGGMDEFSQQLLLRAMDKADAKGAQKDEARTLLAASKPGTRDWWEAYSAYAPKKAARFANNFGLSDAQIKKIKELEPDAKRQYVNSLSPLLQSFMRFRYDIG